MLPANCIQLTQQHYNRVAKWKRLLVLLKKKINLYNNKDYSKMFLQASVLIQKRRGPTGATFSDSYVFIQLLIYEYITLKHLDSVRFWVKYLSCTNTSVSDLKATHCTLYPLYSWQHWVVIGSQVNVQHLLGDTTFVSLGQPINKSSDSKGESANVRQTAVYQGCPGLDFYHHGCTEPIEGKKLTTMK